MSTPTPQPGPIAEAASLVERLYKPETIKVPGLAEGKTIDVIATPKGIDLHSVKKFADEYRQAPERRAGTAVFTRLEGLTDHAKRFKDENSALFAHDDPQSPKLQCVLDYHPKGPDNAEARFGKHRGLYQFPLSPEWQAWQANNGKGMASQEFYEFLERHAIEVAPVLLDLLHAPQGSDAAGEGTDMGTKRLRDMARLLGTDFAGPETLMTLAKGIKVRATSDVEEQRNISTGEVSLVFKTEHRNSDGVPLKVPNLFAISIPVFTQGMIYLIGVRLRYRLHCSKAVWIYDMHRPDLAFTDAFDAACEKVAEDTGLPLFYGNPES